MFFDTIGFKWQYEEEGYTLSNGRWYLPDFKLILPNDNIFYVEVKPEEFDSLGDSQIYDYRLFSKQIEKPIIILTGQPDYNAYNAIYTYFELPNENNNDLFSGGSFSLVVFQDYEPYIKIIDKFLCSLIRTDHNNGHKYLDIDDREARKTFGNDYLSAIKKSKSERF